MPDRDDPRPGPDTSAPRPSLAEIAVQLDQQAAGGSQIAPAAATTPLRATRVASGAWLGGVCTGLAAHLRWPVLLIRAIVVALAAVQLVGAVVYAVLWLAMPIDRSPTAPGIDAATRNGVRTQTSVGPSDIGERLA